MKKRSLPRSDSNGKIKKTETESKSDEANTSQPLAFPFKKHGYQHSAAVRSGKKKTWKNLRQVAQFERAQVSSECPTYLSIDSPPAIKPVKKYSDVSGQLGKYTDPDTGLYYESTLEYKQIKRFPTDIVQGYLALRNASSRL